MNDIYSRENAVRFNWIPNHVVGIQGNVEARQNYNLQLRSPTLDIHQHTFKHVEQEIEKHINNLVCELQIGWREQ